MDFLDFLMSFEHYLPILLQDYGVWIYAILFLIIFAETAFIFMFFLPGDSLLLAIGALCATSETLQVSHMIGLLFIAATLGYIVNYHIGKSLGCKVLNIKSRFIKQEYLYKTHDYFARHGGKTILLARFIPFARSFAPFAAGSSHMNYLLFLTYNLIGAFVWIALLIGIGYGFGNTLKLFG
ncbi:VTT domain-containing protein [Acinetobacter sp. MD2]|uniref:VTT domain-containing protein n=1 Tax=Acinetobacter sp. MD2 TaxID=2600066 RepID=UPI002D1ED0CC|nr:VTT domain-containing protein [Acinetobacter sp. MD2]MEB3768329.1 VTT domain-containing protein [Acinetobacter sp. MD2]